MVELTKLLHEYGGWAVAAIAMLGVWRLWKHIEKREAYIDKLHKEMREDGKEMVEALITTRDTVRSFRDLLTWLHQNSQNQDPNQPSTTLPPTV